MAIVTAYRVTSVKLIPRARYPKPTSRTSSATAGGARSEHDRVTGRTRDPTVAYQPPSVKDHCYCNWGYRLSSAGSRACCGDGRVFEGWIRVAVPRAPPFKSTSRTGCPSPHFNLSCRDPPTLLLRDKKKKKNATRTPPDSSVLPVMSAAICPR